MITVGDVDGANNGFDPTALLTDWETGIVSPLPDGRTLRTFQITGEDKEIEIAPGLFFPAWTYNGRVPGPTLRVTEGDRVRVVFRNNGSHRHSIHFHGIHSARMDGILGAGEIGPGEEFTYEFDAFPFGCHLYHCHALPLKRHIHKGMYGLHHRSRPRPPSRAGREVPPARHAENGEWQEFVMVMNAFDTNFDGENEVYAVNTVAIAMRHPIRVVRNRPVRLYLVNVVEFDPINSLHLHGKLLRLLRSRHDADADAAHRGHGHAVPGSARDPGVQLQGPRDGPVHVPCAPVRVHRARVGGHVRCSGGGGMNDTANLPLGRVMRPGSRLANAVWIVLPLLVLGLAAAWLVVGDPLRAFNNGAPPVEKLTFERQILDSRGLHLLVRAGGSEPMTIAQMQVDDAYWTFTQDPPGSSDGFRRPGSTFPSPGSWARRMS